MLNNIKSNKERKKRYKIFSQEENHLKNISEEENHLQKFPDIENNSYIRNNS